MTASFQTAREASDQRPEDEERIHALRRDINRRNDDRFSRTALAADQLARLCRLEQQERELSTQRRQLHQRIAYLRAGLGLPQTDPRAR